MNKLLLALTLLLGFSVQGATACQPNTASTINNAFFWMETSFVNNEIKNSTGLDMNEENFDNGVFITALDFMNEFSDATPWFNSYHDARGAQIFLHQRLSYLSFRKGFKEKYVGSSEDFSKAFMKHFDTISYCEISKLMQKHFVK